MQRDYRNGTGLDPAATLSYCPRSPSGHHEWVCFRLGRVCQACQMTLSNREWEAVAASEDKD